jgi:DNA-binding transcriptional regulator YiaG
MGRGIQRGSKHHNARLTEAQVEEIRNDLVSTQKALAERFGVSQAQISKIKSRLAWRN